MRYAEFEDHLEMVPPNEEYEALVSVAADNLRQRYAGDRAAYYEAKLSQLQTLAVRIREAIGSSSSVDVHEDIGNIVVSASPARWAEVIRVLEAMEEKRSVRAELFPNTKIRPF